MTTRFLLDTCALHYTTEDQMDAQTEALLTRAFGDGEPVVVSAISAWEIGLLAARGRLPTATAPLRYFDAFVALPGVRLEPATPAILVDSSFLPSPVHRDPADRIIIATARALDLTIVTSDRLILAYASMGHVRAHACQRIEP
jgi:PIN domain nuclease of toxin-antitoxin system